MDHNTIQKLQSISDFPKLVAYLRDELDWPIETDDLDELTFDYELDELGIDEASAAKVLKIRRMRPLDANQPWGIFFLELEPKRLPIVVLRKILSKVVLKNRASSNTSDQTTWKSDDILFVSNFGEKDDRQISFVHFATPENRKDLPVVKVLGWDEDDTKLKVEWIAEQLQSHLHWPDDLSDLEGWRNNWREAFTLRHRQVIQDAETMALQLAGLAKRIRQRIRDVLAVETSKGPMTRLMRAFRESLVSDLNAEGFADMYAQTIAYGLLSARIADPTKQSVDDLAAHMRTSPFLRELMEQFLHIGGRKGKAGVDFDELGVSEVIELLDDTDMEAVIRDFGNRNKQEDPVMHFFEGFLRAYDKKIKKDRGVFYTPQPIVTYIVGSVHELLQNEFGLEDGLADTTTWGEMIERNPELKLPPLSDEPDEKRTISPDEPFVQILDPATGTATFLVEVIDVIYRTLTDKWKREQLSEARQREAWNDYVPQHLLPRLHAFELMMAPYAIAHMKVSLKLLESGYDFGSDERAHIYLANALEPWQRQLKLPELEALAHEAEAVNEVKRYKRFVVVIGNPPYSGRSWNLTPELRRMVIPYRWIEGERVKEKGALQLEKSIQEDYVKFLRLGQLEIEGAEIGVVGFVTSHGFLDNPTLRGLRHSLIGTFSVMKFLDLHGNVSRGERTPSGDADENVFDIKRTGIAISILHKHPSNDSISLSISDMWGARGEKYRWLSNGQRSDEPKVQLFPSKPNFLFVHEDLRLKNEYEKGFSVSEILPVHSKGVVTGRDAFVSDLYMGPLIERMEDFISPSNGDDELIKKYNLNQTDWWNVKKARNKMPQKSQLKGHVKPMLYRPFDVRYCFYHPSVFMSPRRPVMQHFDHNKENLLLITSRMTKGESFAHVTVAKGLAEAILLSSKTSNNAMIFPILLDAVKSGEFQFDDKEYYPAFSRNFISNVESYTGLSVTSSIIGDLKTTFGARDLLNYIFAILHSPTYRSRYKEFLKRDFPHIPLTDSLELFSALARLGRELIALHLLESSVLESPVTEYIGSSRQVTNKVMWTDDDGGTVWIDGSGTKKNPGSGASGFRPVPEGVWKFHVGGYQVCEKWLKDRGPKKGKPGRTLTDEDIAHYQKIVIALTETILLMAETDEVIDTHGGWPDAFAPTADPDHQEYPHLMAADSPDKGLN